MNKIYKRRRVHDFVSNIIRNFGTVILGSILFVLIFIAVYMIKDKLHESRIVYAAVLETRPAVLDANKSIDIEEEFKRIMSSEAVEKALKDEIAIDIPYEDFLEYVTVRISGANLLISFEDMDEEYAKVVVTKVFNATAYEFMKEYGIESFEIIKPATFKVDASQRDWTHKSIYWFMAIGAALGGGLTLLALCAFYMLDNTIKDEQDVREYLDLPVLSVIPADKSSDDRKGGAL